MGYEMIQGHLAPALRSAPDLKSAGSGGGILSIGDRVFPGRYGLHSRFEKAVNFTDGDRLVSIVNEEIGRGPVNIVFRGCRPPPAGPLLIDEENVAVNGEVFRFDRQKIFNSSIDFKAADFTGLEKNLPVFEEALKDLSPAKSLAFLLDAVREKNFTAPSEKIFLKRVKGAVRIIFNDVVGSRHNVGGSIGTRCPSHRLQANYIEGIKRLKGLGYGLTPAGDDFIAGLLVAFNLLEGVRGKSSAELKEKTRRAAQGNNLLVNSFLRLVEGGFYIETLQQLILSLFGRNRRRIFDRTEGFLDRGETSGSDLAVGCFLALKSGLFS